jgi:hypothetical protein
MSTKLQVDAQTVSFRFANAKLQQKLLIALRRAGIRHVADRRGAVQFAVENEAFVENTILLRIRNSVFPRWQILSCPANWGDRYRRYMAERNIPYEEEIADGETSFLISAQYRPHAWKL